jgi:hypothetical protein
LIEVKHTGENIAERIACVIKEYGLIDKVFSVILDNVSSNVKAMNILTPMFASYLGPDSTTEHVDSSNRKYSLVHQRCACHIINLIVKSDLKRFKHYLEDFRSTIKFFNSSNQALWEKIFGGPGYGVVGPSPASALTSSSYGSAICELSVYLDSDNVTAYEDDFDLLLW